MKNEHNERNVVLYVEDEYYNYLVIEKMLKNLNVTMLRAENGIVAIEIFTENKDISLVLMDIKLGGMDGLEVTKQFKQIRPEVPIIAVTAYAISGDKERILEAGCNDYISKPVKWEVLLSAVERYLH